MPDVEWNKNFWDGYAWPANGEEWSAHWGDARTQWWTTILPRIAGCLPARKIVEIAPGRGRWTEFLLPSCRAYAGYDVSENCVRFCSNRFRRQAGWFKRVDFFRTDGCSLLHDRANSADFVFSFDSLVHAERDVLDGYLSECSRILRPGGRAFLHHSNVAGIFPRLEAYDHLRGRSVSAETVRTRCAELGLLVFVQEVVSWADVDSLDCFSLIAKAPVPSFRGTMQLTNSNFWNDVARLRGTVGPYLASSP